MILLFVSHANRGMDAEELVEFANNIYYKRNWALVRKVPTPVKIIRNGRKKSAFFSDKSTVDYVGIAFGKAVAFDVKSIRERKRFPLSNVKQHQVEFLKRFQQQGGVAFLLINFVKYDEWYVVQIQDFLPYYDRAQKGGRKSIPYKDFKYFQQVKANGIGLDYLEFLRKEG